MSASAAPRRVIILGSTGSIGCNTIEVIEHLASSAGRRFQIVGLAAGGNGEALARQAKTLGVSHLALADGSRANDLPSSATTYTGSTAALELIEAVAQPGDLVIGAMVGAAGVPATLAAIERGCDVALANKETLVAAGALVMPLVKQRDVALLPVDSEHSAIFQCLLAGRSIDEVKQLVITASGGPFRTWTRQQLDDASVAQALKHPTWNMGRKVTIDSATLMNKALEIIEAHWLFGLGPDKIEALVHPQSIVHGFVEFIDGSVLAQLGPPDMKLPIQYAMTWPDRAVGSSRSLDWRSLASLDFEPVDRDRFPSIGLAYRVIERGGTSGAIFNAANEAAVEAFLEERIRFPEITALTADALQAIEPGPVRTMADVVAADRAARLHVAARLGSGAVSGAGVRG